MIIVKNFPTALFVFFLCLISPAILACEAVLKLEGTPGFVNRGLLGKTNEYSQRVYSTNGISFSTVVFTQSMPFDKQKAQENMIRSMVKAGSARSKIPKKPDVRVLKRDLLPVLDKRLAFASYVTFENNHSINVEASGAIQDGECWALLRFTALREKTRDEALDIFAMLIRNTQLES